MHKTLFTVFFLISLVFYSCSSTKSLTDCPGFNKRASSNKCVKLRKAKSKKKAISKDFLTKKVVDRKSKKVDRLANRLEKKLVHIKNNDLNIDTLDKRHLYELLKTIDLDNSSNELLTVENGLLNDSEIEKTILPQPKREPKKLNHSDLFLDADIKPTKVIKNSIHKKRAKTKSLKKQAKLTKPKKLHGLAIAAFICAMTSIGTLAFAFGAALAIGTGLGIFALIFGAFAVDRIEEEPKKFKGRTLAIVASILGLIGVVFAIGLFGLLVSA